MRDRRAVGKEDAYPGDPSAEAGVLGQLQDAQPAQGRYVRDAFYAIKKKARAEVSLKQLDNV